MFGEQTTISSCKQWPHWDPHKVVLIQCCVPFLLLEPASPWAAIYLTGDWVTNAVLCSECITMSASLLSSINAKSSDQSISRLASRSCTIPYYIHFQVGILHIEPLQPQIHPGTLCPLHIPLMCACLTSSWCHRNVKSLQYLSLEIVTADQHCVDMSTLLCAVRIIWNPVFKNL